MVIDVFTVIFVKNDRKMVEFGRIWSNSTDFANLPNRSARHFISRPLEKKNKF